MKKKELLIQKLVPILDNDEEVEKFLIENSNLPGRRANIELGFLLSEVYENVEKIIEWSKISASLADVDNPKSFLAFCSAICLGSQYLKNRDKNMTNILKNLANDERWRIREAVVFGFQIIGRDNFSELKNIFSEWIKEANNFEKRAILVSLADSQVLNKETSIFSFKLVDFILSSLDQTPGYDVLLKGLNFVISVFVASNPECGFKFIEKWFDKSKLINKILESNLKKKRLMNTYPSLVKKLLKEKLVENGKR